MVDGRWTCRYEALHSLRAGVFARLPLDSGCFYTRGSSPSWAVLSCDNSTSLISTGLPTLAVCLPRCRRQSLLAFDSTPPVFGDDVTNQHRGRIIE